jgi:hypothetical protein
VIPLTQKKLTFMAMVIALLLTPAFAQAQQPESAVPAAVEPTGLTPASPKSG